MNAWGKENGDPLERRWTGSTGQVRTVSEWPGCGGRQGWAGPSCKRVGRRASKKANTEWRSRAVTSKDSNKEGHRCGFERLGRVRRLSFCPKQ
jgi:hypothetical protein